MVRQCSLLTAHSLQFFLWLFSTSRWQFQVQRALTLTGDPYAGYTVWDVILPGPTPPHPPFSYTVGAAWTLQRLRCGHRSCTVLVAVVVTAAAAAVVAATMMADPSSWGGRLAGTRRLYMVVGVGLRESLLPGWAPHHLQLQALLTATSTQGHRSFSGDCVNPGGLQCNTSLQALGKRWVFCREAMLHWEVMFGGTNSSWDLQANAQNLSLSWSTEARRLGGLFCR